MFKPIRSITHNLSKYSTYLTIAIPYLWLLIFFFLPFLVILKISFAQYIIGIPPISKLINFSEEGFLQIKLFFDGYATLFDFEDPLYIAAYLNSLKIALVSTILCLLVAYPMAYGIARAKKPIQSFLLFLVILPFWTSFLIRVYAWIGILKNNGLLNNFLIWLGVIDQPLMIINTNIAVYIGIVYSYLPFMILPLFATLEKLDHTLLEASADLGANPLKSFFNITLPLSIPGIIAGSLLVFIPVVGEFVIPELLGGSSTLMIGKVLWSEFFNNRDWPVASAVAIGMLCLLLIPIFYLQRQQAKTIKEA